MVTVTSSPSRSTTVGASVITSPSLTVTSSKPCNSGRTLTSSTTSRKVFSACSSPSLATTLTLYSPALVWSVTNVPVFNGSERVTVTASPFGSLTSGLTVTVLPSFTIRSFSSPITGGTLTRLTTIFTFLVVVCTPSVAVKVTMYSPSSPYLVFHSPMLFKGRVKVYLISSLSASFAFTFSFTSSFSLTVIT